MGRANVDNKRYGCFNHHMNETVSLRVKTYAQSSQKSDKYWRLELAVVTHILFQLVEHLIMGTLNIGHLSIKNTC